MKLIGVRFLGRTLLLVGLFSMIKF